MNEPRLRIALPLLALLCLIRLWLMPLPSSFWVDEMATVFVVDHGASDPSLNVAPQVPQSIYYAAIRPLVSGRAEVAYRLPSIVFMALALWLVALLARRLIHPGAAWFAIFACFSLKGIDYEAANARPYAMGICVAAAALYFLVRWLDTAKPYHAALFLTFATLLWRVHLIFWPFYLVFALYALRRSKDVPRWHLALTFSLLGILLIPVALRAIHLNAQAKAHVVMDQPTWRDLEKSLKPLLIAAAALGAWIWSRFAKPRLIAPTSSVALILAWWLWHPVALFAFSRFTGNSVFVPRYLTLCLPGAALAATLAAACFLPPRFWKPAALIMGAAALIANGNWSEPWPPHHNSDWRGAAQAINRLNLPPSVPILCPSPFIEARPPAWTPDYKMPGFLYAHLLVYPVRGHVQLLPYADSPAAAIPTTGPFVVYGAQFLQKPGWTRRSLGQFRDVQAVLFEQPN